MSSLYFKKKRGVGGREGHDPLGHDLNNQSVSLSFHQASVFLLTSMLITSF